MDQRYELKAIFQIQDPKRLIRYARRRHRECYPPGTKDAPPAPRDIASALADSLIDCKEGAPIEELGLTYLESQSGPLQEQEERALEAARILFARTGGRGPAWEALEKILEAILTRAPRHHRRKRRK